MQKLYFCEYFHSHQLTVHCRHEVRELGGRRLARELAVGDDRSDAALASRHELLDPRGLCDCGPIVEQHVEQHVERHVERHVEQQVELHVEQHVDRGQQSGM